MGKHRLVRPARSLRPLSAALRILKAAALGCLLSLVVIGGLRTSDPAATTNGPAAAGAYERVVARAAIQQQCPSGGSAPGSFPGSSAASALIRTEGGQVRAVSFETGWDVFNGRRPGSLIAVCVD
jgi:hypothetical protein